MLRFIASSIALGVLIALCPTEYLSSFEAEASNLKQPFVEGSLTAESKASPSNNSSESELKLDLREPESPKPKAAVKSDVKKTLFYGGAQNRFQVSNFYNAYTIASSDSNKDSDSDEVVCSKPVYGGTKPETSARKCRMEEGREQDLKFGLNKYSYGLVANRPYLGASGGFGEVKTSRESFMIRSGLITQVQDQPTFLGLLSVSPKNGGLSGRLYAGIVSAICNPIAIGPEVGYSYYKFSSVASNEEIAYANYADFHYYDKIKYSAFGADLLGNVSLIYKRMTLAVKSGIQFAVQKGTVYSRLTVTEEGGTAEDLPLRDIEFKRCKVLPEIIFQAKWQIVASLPIYVGFSYQYVWGEKIDNSGDNNFSQVNSRNMATLDIEIHGW